MGIFDNPFSNAGKAANTGGPNPQSQPQPNASGFVPENTNTNTEVKKENPEPNDPLLDFAKIWDPVLDKEGKPVVKAGPAAHLPVVDAKQFDALMEKMDFTKQLTPEDFEGVKKGGDDAVGSLLQILNKVQRGAFKSNFAAMQKMVEQGLQNVSKSMAEQVPHLAKDLMVDTALAGDNPLMKNPAFKPMVDMVKSQYREKFPKAGVDETNKAVRSYFDKMYSDMDGAKKKANTKESTNDQLLSKGDANANWQDWFEDGGAVAQPDEAAQT